MNRKIGMYSSIINVIAVVAFALCMIVGSNYGSYLVCIFIAFSFVPMMSTFCHYSSMDKKVAGYIAIVFSAIYAVFILAVYYAQVTAVALDGLNEQATQIIDYSKFGLFFSYDLLGYGIMALATFFVGLTVDVKSKTDKFLKWLLIIHGIFFVSCFIMPMLGLFSPNMQGADWIGVAVLEFWCIYFIPIGVLSFMHFKKKT
ncbi:MAG: hypothetical protein GX567_01415 [Clostridia bacterium]|nr:hypothetical protein [Clostridia bacterium]